MLPRNLAAIAAACTALAILASEPVLADGTPTVTVAKTVKYSPRRHLAYHYIRGVWPGGPDPYSYSYNRPGYYPDYSSNMWVPRRQMLGRSKYPMLIPEYFSSWGYPLPCKIHGRRNCGVPFIKPAGDPGHYYRRDAQLPGHGHE